ncbi:MAG TPA: hypothetical protein VMW43_04615 [Bacteroidota bacterium]|nr:hypothetical protein [Bacteroidota bacterium]
MAAFFATVSLSLLLLPATVPAQPVPDSLASYFQFEDAAPLSCLYTWFPPFFIQHDLEMKRFVRSRRFAALRQVCGDRKAVDALFVRAMKLTNNNTAVSLLLCALASFDHQTVGLRIPVFSLFFPLSEESDAEFSRRIANLPRRLFEDTPADETGDRDKLQHFFGSAFLTFISESDHAAERFGDFVERTEDAVIVGGVDDDRDRSANREGQRFGLWLLNDNRRVPSEFFRKRLLRTGRPASGNGSSSHEVW